MRPSWQQQNDQMEVDFLKRQTERGEIESRNNLNGGISRHLGLGDGRSGIEWTGAGIEIDSSRRHELGDWPLWVWLLLAGMLALGLGGLWLQQDSAQSAANAANPAAPATAAPHTP